MREWEEWTGMRLPADGLYVLPGALVPMGRRLAGVACTSSRTCGCGIPYPHRRSPQTAYLSGFGLRSVTDLEVPPTGLANTPANQGFPLAG